MKTSHAVLATAALLLSTSVFAQAPDSTRELNNEEAQMCARMTCQYNVRVVLKDKTGATFDRTFRAFPAVVQPHGITVIAGKTVFIEADIVDGKLSNLVLVDHISNPSKTMTAKLEQVDGKGMILTTRNPFQKWLKFSMAIMPLESEQVSKTTSCPIGPGIQTFETWPYPIFQILIDRGRLLENGDSLACTE